jgi:hypothetical protein
MSTETAFVAGLRKIRLQWVYCCRGRLSFTYNLQVCFLNCRGPTLESRMAGVENPAEGRLFEAELFWRDHQPWLKECGYLLRPRYLPDWKASWVRNKSLHYRDCEDGIIMGVRT